MRTWVSIALFFLISAFFLFALLAALHHSRKAVAVASACLAVAVCVIVFLTPVRLPTWLPLNQRDGYRIYQGGTTTTTESTPAPGPGDPDEPGTTLTTEGIGL